eukprot:1689378-Rhodomonas_salina.1
MTLALSGLRGAGEREAAGPRRSADAWRGECEAEERRRGSDRARVVVVVSEAAEPQPRRPLLPHRLLLLLVDAPGPRLRQ